MTVASPTPCPARRVDHTRTSRIVLTGLWADAVLVMAASAYNGGLAFAALGQDFGAGIALGVAVDVGLAVALIGDRALHLAGRQSHWGRALRICTAVMSLALNCAVALWLGHYGVAAFHAFLPILLILLSEYAQDSTLQFGEIAAEHDAVVKAERDAALAADRARWEAERHTPATVASFPTVGESPPDPPPIGPPAPPVFRAVPTWAATQPQPQPETTPAPQPAGRPADPSVGRPDPAPAGRPAGQPAGRSDAQPERRPDASPRPAPARRPGAVFSGRPRTGTPRTDEQLVAAIRALTERNGGRAPSQYQLRQALGIGGPRAARLLADLDTTPAADPAGHGAATRKEKG